MLVSHSPSLSLPRVLHGALFGSAAWSAYALGEFLCTSVLFRLVRPYATFTSWHWQMTAQLLVAFLLAGALAGALSTVLLYTLRRFLPEGTPWDAPDTLDIAACCTLPVAFLVGIWSNPTADSRSFGLRALTAALILLLVLSLRSTEWRHRLGLLVNGWVVAALLLVGSQQVAVSQMDFVATRFGSHIGFVHAAIYLAIVILAAGACALGRRIQFLRGRMSLHWLQQAAIVSTLVLLLTSIALAMLKPPTPPNPPPQAASPQPNVLLIVMDTVRADHLSVYGYGRDTTPNLKRLAAESVIYPNALSAADITLTSHASLFTGVYPSWHGAYCQPPDATYGGAVRKNVPTLAEVMKQGGYATLGVAANLYLRSDFGLQRGFDAFHIPRPVPIIGAENSHLLRTGIRRAISPVLDTRQYNRLFSRGQEINETLFARMAGLPASSPFFVFVNYMDAHFPYVAPEPFHRMFRKEDLNLLNDDLSAIFDNVSRGAAMPQRERDWAVSQYDGGIAYIDSRIGEIVAYLKQTGRYDNTLIIVTSDHGEAFGERNYVGHGNSPYHNLLGVGLIVKYPAAAQVQPRTVTEPVSLIDVFPTVVSAAGLKPPATLQGQNLLAGPRPRTLHAETFPCPVHRPPECAAGCTSRVAVDWPHKFLAMSNGRMEMFDLAKDPAERRNLLREIPEISRALGLKVTEWARTRPAQDKQKVQLDAESLERLRSLGYIQGK